jgi:hypothetical protein
MVNNRLLLTSPGSRNHLARLDTNSSSGCYCMTELTPKTSWEERISLSNLISVSTVGQVRKRLSFTYFGLAHLPQLAGTIFVLREYDTLQCWKISPKLEIS